MSTDVTCEHALYLQLTPALFASPKTSTRFCYTARLPLVNPLFDCYNHKIQQPDDRYSQQCPVPKIKNLVAQLAVPCLL